MLVIEIFERIDVPYDEVHRSESRQGIDAYNICAEHVHSSLSKQSCAPKFRAAIRSWMSSLL